ncbi:GspH/FimT family protein, partial [Psychrobacter sp. bablab_jr014]
NNGGGNSSNNGGGNSGNNGGGNSGNNGGGNSGNNGGGNSGSGNSGGSGNNSGESNGGTGSSTPTGENLVIIQTYNYDEKSTIKSSVSTNKIVFKPNGTVNQAVTYTICDSNKSASPIQVVVSSKGLISSKPGGVC